MTQWMIIALFFTAHHSGCNSQDSVDQKSRFQTALKGAAVTISCTYKSTDPSPTLFWYQQKVNGFPKYMLSKFSNDDKEFKERFNASIDTSSKSFPLIIQDLHVSDSAVYYCALRPTDLKWESNTNAILKKVQQRMYFLQLRKYGLPQELLAIFYTAAVESILCTSITVWFGAATKQDKHRLQRVIRTAEKIIGVSLPSLEDLYTCWTRKRAENVIKDCTNPAYTLFNLLLSGSFGEDAVNQPKEDRTAIEGEQITLNCEYETLQTAPYLYWYIQRSNNLPEYILMRYKFGSSNSSDFKDRFDARLDTKSVPLIIQDLHVSDSAVYYCALQPTVTKTHSTLIQ
nr:uncharacterized protein LOC129443365 [Misgurnus anguillicaudatus]